MPTGSIERRCPIPLSDAPENIWVAGMRRLASVTPNEAVFLQNTFDDQGQSLEQPLTQRVDLSVLPVSDGLKYDLVGYSLLGKFTPTTLNILIGEWRQLLTGKQSQPSTLGELFSLLGKDAAESFDDLRGEGSLFLTQRVHHCLFAEKGLLGATDWVHATYPAQEDFTIRYARFINNWRERVFWLGWRLAAQRERLQNEEKECPEYRTLSFVHPSGVAEELHLNNYQCYFDWEKTSLERSLTLFIADYNRLALAVGASMGEQARHLDVSPARQFLADCMSGVDFLRRTDLGVFRPTQVAVETKSATFIDILGKPCVTQEDLPYIPATGGSGRKYFGSVPSDPSSFGSVASILVLPSGLKVPVEEEIVRCPLVLVPRRRLNTMDVRATQQHPI